MSRGLNIPGVVFVFLCLGLAPLSWAGEEVDDFADLDLEELLDVVVTASKHEQDIAESPSAISVITREQIENTSCSDVICLLRGIPEMDVMSMTPMYPAVGARALTDNLGNKVLALVDGREINNEILGFPFWQSMSVHLGDIERIEVIRGPGSALYGANAHSAVVSIITRKTTDQTAEVFVGAGEHAQSSFHARLGRRFGNWRVHLSGGYEVNDNWRIRDLHEREVARSRLVVAREGREGLSTLQLGLTTLEGIYSTVLAPLWLRDGLLGYAVASHETEMLRAQVSLTLADSDISLDMPLVYNGTKIGEAPDSMKAFNSSLDTELQFTYSFFEGNLLIAGCNHRWITLLSDDNQPEETYQHRVGVFVHDEQRLARRLVLTAGARVDYNNITPLTFSPRVAGVWQFLDDQFLRLAFGIAFRKPNFFNTHLHMKGFKGESGFEELGEFFLNSIGNPDLENESITSFEVGYRGRYLDNRLNTELVLFYNLYRDGIRNVVDMRIGEFGLPDLSRSSMKFQNAGREVDSVGGSVSATFRIRKRFYLHANYTYRFSRYVSSPDDPVAALEGQKGDRVPFEPAHMFNAAVHYLMKSGVRLGLDVHARSSSDLANPRGGGVFDPFVLVHNPAYWYLSSFLAFRADLGSGYVEMGVKAYNTFHIGFRDMAAVTRADGMVNGGELIGRRIFLYLQGAI
jgi:outer membrane receptor for ferrienterochelin and colicin